MTQIKTGETLPPYSYVRTWVISGAVVGRIVEVEDHPNADRLWLAVVDVGDRKLRIVFGGRYRCQPGDLVPVAPPGAKLSTGRRMRTRSYRGQRSEGMLCSSNELGWTSDGPDAVHVLTSGYPGQPLHTGGTAMDDMATVFRRDPAAEVDQVAALGELASDLGVDPAALAKAATRRDVAPRSVVVTLGGSDSGNRSGS